MTESICKAVIEHKGIGFVYRISSVGVENDYNFLNAMTNVDTRVINIYRAFFICVGCNNSLSESGKTCRNF